MAEVDKEKQAPLQNIYSHQHHIVQTQTILHIWASKHVQMTPRIIIPTEQLGDPSVEFELVGFVCHKDDHFTAHLYLNGSMYHYDNIHILHLLANQEALFYVYNQVSDINVSTVQNEDPLSRDYKEAQRIWNSTETPQYDITHFPPPMEENNSHNNNENQSDSAAPIVPPKKSIPIIPSTFISTPFPLNLSPHHSPSPDSEALQSLHNGSLFDVWCAGCDIHEDGYDADSLLDTIQYGVCNFWSHTECIAFKFNMEMGEKFKDPKAIFKCLRCMWDNDEMFISNQ
ncbi:hypothetical protein F5146DRAFT_1145835 [Armillaria mellea]|nr:hypothetical protein F5146DRAFT_1145835 [Armillaria mellea]